MMRSLVAALLIAGGASAQAVPPGVMQESRQLPGLSAPGEIVIDHAGIPHIYAANARDGFFLQGYAVARDRLWQIDLWRKRGLGRLAASFGPAFVAQDRAARLFLYRGDMAAEWAAYAPGAKGWTQGFVTGINAFIAEVEAGRAPLPLEFAATATRPERWQADDVVRIRSNALASNLASEVARARALCGGDVKLEPLRRTIEPARPVTIPKGLDPCSIPEKLLDDYALGTGEVRLDGGTLVLAGLDPDNREGSNNWVIGPGRSATGRPILANDPHRAHSIPNLRYLSHIDTPELQIAGAGEPALPGISFGHNADAAWAITIFAIDQQDLVVNPKAAKLTEVRETIDVKGEAPRDVVLKFSSDGPIIHEDPASGRSFALRATWDRPGASAYFNATWAFQAKGWSDFLVARNHWGAPPLNLMFAGRDGDIGWAPGGFVPVRAAGDGLLPVPAGAAYRWTGLLDARVMPVKHNPPEGWIATANEMNLPAGYAHLLGLDSWADRSRITRISEVIGAKAKFGITDAMALQNDATSPMARRAVALLAGLAGRSDGERTALALLAGWDGHEGPDSAAAALYEIWARSHLPAAAVKAIVPAAMQANFGRTSIGALLPVLEAGTLVTPDQRSAILLESLGSAVAEASRLLGPDPGRWRWGALHVADFKPALPIAGRDAERRVGPLPIGGSGSTPMAMGPAADWHVASGASVRLVMDVGAWDNSMAINTPGQSGDPASPHYRDLFPRWASGNYVPFAWSRPRVLQEAERIITVNPLN
ncbi:MAG: penicillin acylase family protein [Alphaproteobacteria bacterium]|nr:penicillin acylase family protein [Alphaproteobacteria bacterium]